MDVELENRLAELFKNDYANRNKTFGNGRHVRNMFEKVLENQANRLAKTSQINKESLIQLTAADIE